MSEEQAERVRALLRQLRDASFDGNATAMAKALGLTQSAISQVLSTKNRPSYSDTVVPLAAHLGVEPAAILAGEVTGPASGPRDQYPERARALARLRGVMVPDVEEALLSMEVHDKPLTEVEWLELAIRRLAEHIRASDIEARLSRRQ